MKLITLILLLFFTNLAGATTEKREGYLVKTFFKYKSQEKNIESSGELVFGKNNRAWATLVSTEEGFTVLGKIVEAKGDALHMEYIVVESGRLPNSIVSTPQIMSKLGEEAIIEVGGDSEVISLKTMAREI